MEKVGIYKFRIVECKWEPKKWLYQIMNDNNTVRDQSKEAFQHKGVARFAAIGHISLLEQGKT